MKERGESTPVIVGDGDGWRLTAEQWVPVAREELFPFFADASNLEKLTPDTLRFRILPPAPVEMTAGTTIDYRLGIRGVPVRWRSEITVWEPPRRFVDVQLRGPYVMWHHEHRFDEHDGGTLCIDHVRYRVPGGPLAPLVHRLFVERDVREIFDFRARKLRELFGGPD